MFRRVLIANRGEIAARIVRACRELGVETVLAHSEADYHAPWLKGADRTVCIGPARSEESYLNADAVLQAAEQTCCQAIHPGYGFLAENAQFAARCEQQGITFVGPGAGAIRRMGDKVEAKRTMAAAGLPVLPGSDGAVTCVDDALASASKIGYPVLLKARAGGGGRGMRRCRSARELERAFDQAATESARAFGDPGLYLEKLVEGGRHIEFQVLCDAFGRAVHLGERECSIQRQHQKLLEESPSPVVPQSMRNEFGARIARAVARIGYRNAGTVEFLRAPGGELFFMEMNTRIQVEHPVTEMVTGVDLVVEQLRVAANFPLELRQESIGFRGHALEMRINAEDPDAGFLPAPGTITSVVEPPEMLDGCRVRWDSGVETGYRIPPHYDSLIGKLIVHGSDRSQALRGARAAIGALKIEGIPTTRELFTRILNDPGFERGEYDIDFLTRSGPLAAA